jgi:hypothetical protein
MNKSNEGKSHYCLRSTNDVELADYVCRSPKENTKHKIFYKSSKILKPFTSAFCYYG